MRIESLDAALKAVCPIDGVSIGRWHDRSTWRVDFREEATEGQRAAAHAVLQDFDPALPELRASAKDLLDAMLELSPARRSALKVELSKP